MDIRRGHALDLIQDVGAFDLLVTDPPYAFGGQGVKEHALGAVVATTLREAATRLRRGRWAVIFAASSWRSTNYMIEATRGILEPVRFGTWAKPRARTKVHTSGWAWASVNVIVLRKPGKDPLLSEVRIERLDHITAEPVRNGRVAELPPEVCSWAVAPYVTTGLALDPFAGSGALLRAAEALGMETLGFELD